MPTAPAPGDSRFLPFISGTIITILSIIALIASLFVNNGLSSNFNDKPIKTIDNKTLTVDCGSIDVNKNKKSIPKEKYTPNTQKDCDKPNTTKKPPPSTVQAPSNTTVTTVTVPTTIPMLVEKTTVETTTVAPEPKPGDPIDQSKEPVFVQGFSDLPDGALSPGNAEGENFSVIHHIDPLNPGSNPDSINDNRFNAIADMYDASGRTSKSPIAVNQGDPLFISRINDNATNPQSVVCTAGFIDHKKQRIWLAGHCGDDDNVIVWRDAQHTIKLGNLTVIGNLSEMDKAYVDIQNPQLLGDNVYSSDMVAGRWSAGPGSRVCAFSRRHNHIACGAVSTLWINQRDPSNWFGLVNPDVGVDPQSNGSTSDPQAKNSSPIIQGDSGGPVWIESSDKTHRAFIGVLTWTYPSHRFGFTGIRPYVNTNWDMPPMPAASEKSFVTGQVPPEQFAQSKNLYWLSNAELDFSIARGGTNDHPYD